MKYINITPKGILERKTCEEVANLISPCLLDTTTLMVRTWDQDPPFPDGKYIALITCAEGHMYIPPETDDPNCIGVFMNYYPKRSIEYQFTPGEFLNVPNLYPLQLGVTNHFTGDADIPIQDRPIDVSFVGRFDPYTRADFFEAVSRYGEEIPNSIFHFYDNWTPDIGDRYSSIMSRTKIALVPCSTSGLDSYRYYEAAKCGCVILTIDQNPYEFMEEQSHVCIDSWDEMKLAIEVILSRKRDMVDAFRETKIYWKERLSPGATVSYILSKIGEQ